MEQHTVVAAYDATAEAGDGLALARLLAAHTDSELLVTRVMTDRVGNPVADRALARTVRDEVGATRRAMVAALPDASLAESIIPTLDASVAHALHEVARAHDATLLVLGSSHHSRLGRLLFGGTADLIVDHAPCPVAVAPPHFRDVAEIDPPVVGCAYDGGLPSIDALHVAVDLARAFDIPLQVIAVAPTDVAARLLDDADSFVREWGDGTVSLECTASEGEPAATLLGAANGVGLLLVGSRAIGPVRRALLGSVSARVLREARCPVVVVPRRR